jgi:hypothetical protein
MNNEPLKLPNPETAIDRMRAHLFHDVQLSDRELELLDRYNWIDNQINSGLTDKEIVSAVKKQFDISASQAYKDISTTKLVFASRSILDKEYYRWWLFQQHLKLYRKLELNDRFREMVELQKQIFKTLGLDKDEQKALDPDQYGNHNFFMIINQDSGPKVQINFNEAHKLTEAEFRAIREQIESNYQTQQEGLLNQYIDERHRKHPGT